MTRSLLEIRALEKSFEGVRALSSFSCALRNAEILGLIGPNGAGKTTLFNVITGHTIPDRGSVLLKGAEVVGVPPHRVARLGVARTFQDLRLIRRLSVLDNVLLGFTDQPGELLRNVFFRRKASLDREAKNREAALSLLKEAQLADRINDPAEDLSYGQQKLLSIVCCLATGAELLLLDEPVAGIAPAMAARILAIIGELPRRGKSVILIEHNIDAVMQVCERLVFMDAGAKIADGAPDKVRNDPRVIEAYLE